MNLSTFTDWHTYEEYWVDTELEQSMQLAQDISSLVHSLRKAHRIQSTAAIVHKVLIPVLSEKHVRQIARCSDYHVRKSM
ncbi:MAG: hypothetical protein R2822_16970 [Spirosomataceae bacterium]